MYTLSVKMYGYLIKLIFALEVIFKAKKKNKNRRSLKSFVEFVRVIHAYE